MHIRKKIVIVALVLLASAFLIVGTLTEFLISEETIRGTHTYSDYTIIPPESNSSVEFEVNVNQSDLRIELAANNTLIVSVLQNETLRWEWEASELKRNILGDLEAGIWTVNFQNNSTEKSCSCTYIITVTESYHELTKPHTWLRTPLFVSSLFTLLLVPSIHFYDRIKRRVNMRFIKIALISIIVFSFVFSYQIAGVILQTSHPWAVTHGISMEPTMQEGDLVIIRGVDPKNLVPGDIILYQQILYNVTPPFSGAEPTPLSTPIMHRIVNTLRIGNHTYFQTQGDNELMRDDWFVPDEAVIGSALFIVPKLGTVVIWLSLIEVKLFLISLIIFALLIWPQIKPSKRQTK